MKRDLDLIRRILVELEDSSNPLPASVFADSSTTTEIAARHIELMRQAGLIEASVAKDLSGNLDATAESLTWEGFDFLDAIRSDTIWAKAKTKVAKTLGSVSVSTLKAVAVKMAEEVVL